MPVRFEIYRGGKRLTQYSPAAAYALGQEATPVAGDVFFRDGYLTVNRQDPQAVGVGLLWDCGAGTFVTETTRLKVRDKPYILNVELARGRLMRILQKMEDWNLFDYPRTEKLAEKFKAAQQTLAQAIARMNDDPASSSQLADMALKSGTEVGDELASFHVELLLARRRAQGNVARHVLGCRIEPGVASAGYYEALVQGFDYAIVPLNWRKIQPREEEINTGPLDQLLDLLVLRRMPVVAGPLVDLSEAAVPDWMFIWEHDYETLRDLTYEHVQRMIQRYRRQVSVWNVCAGLHTHSSFTLSFDQVIEFTRLLVGQVKAALPSARTLVTIRQPFGEYHARHRHTVPPMIYAEMVAQSGIPFEAFGVEIEMGVPAPGMFDRDLFQLSAMLDKFASFGRPVFLTAMCAPSRNYPDASDASDGRLDPAAAGVWGRPWDEALQADWMEAVAKLALSKPYIESMAWSALADVGHALPGGGMFDAAMRPRPVYTKAQELRTLFHSWSNKRQPGERPERTPPAQPGPPAAP